MIKLRPYQESTIQNIRLEFAKGNRSLILCAPTGAGKTIMFTDIAKRTVSKGGDVLVITNRTELLKQAGSSFEKFGLTPKYLTARTKPSDIHTGDVWVGMVETIKRRLKVADYRLFVAKFTLIIIDEAHLNNFNRLFEVITPFQYVIGATATPHRTGKMKPLSNFYDTIVESASIPYLVQKGYLSKPKTYSVPVDLSKVRLTAGEFNASDLSKTYDKTELYHGVLNNWRKYTPNKKTLIFCATVKNSVAITNTMKQAGIDCRHLDAETPEAERNQILEDFAASKFTVLSNVGILTTGYDCPDVEVVVLYRATRSLPLYLQMVGRGSRTTPNKNTFTILDFGENVKRHDFWQSERTWSLDIQRPPSKLGEIPIKECKSCGCLIPASANICPECGYIIPQKKKVKSHIEVLLEEMTPSQLNAYADTANIQELESIRTAKGYKIGWILFRLKTLDQFKQYETLKGYKKGWALIQWKIYEKHRR